jgi:hypothetical protein
VGRGRNADPLFTGQVYRVCRSSGGRSVWGARNDPKRPFVAGGLKDQDRPGAEWLPSSNKFEMQTIP